MSDWSPSIVKIQKIIKHPNADNLSIATVMDIYPVIIRTGEFKEGELVAFIPYDSVLPDLQEWHFLSPKQYEKYQDENGETKQRQIGSKYPVGSVPARYRTIKSKRILNLYSEGLITKAPPGFKEGDSIVDHFQLTKRVYDEELPESGSSLNETSPQTFQLFKYDLDGVAKYGYVFEEGEQVIITEKIEGENFSVTYAEDKLWCRSRNFFKKETDDNHFWQAAKSVNLHNTLKDYPNLSVWGECYGNVKGWKYDCPVVHNTIQRKFRVFDVWDIVNKKFLEWDQVVDLCQKLNLETVPVLYVGPWKSDKSLYELAEGTSTIGTCVREGCVIKSVPEGWHPKLGRKILKLKGRGYKLAKD